MNFKIKYNITTWILQFITFIIVPNTIHRIWNFASTATFLWPHPIDISQYGKFSGANFRNWNIPIVSVYFPAINSYTGVVYIVAALHSPKSINHNLTEKSAVPSRAYFKINHDNTFFWCRCRCSLELVWNIAFLKLRVFDELAGEIRWERPPCQYSF